MILGSSMSIIPSSLFILLNFFFKNYKSKLYLKFVDNNDSKEDNFKKLKEEKKLVRAQLREQKQLQKLQKENL